METKLKGFELPIDLDKKIKVEAIEKDKREREIIIEALQDYFKKQEGKK